MKSMGSLLTTANHGSQHTPVQRRQRRGLPVLLRLAALAGLTLSLVTQPAPAYAAVYSVNTTSDTDDGTCNDADCSLREAINAANANPGPDTISFNIPGGPPYIILASTLPVLSDGGTTIDGTTQPGSVPGTPIIQVRGDPAIQRAGLRLQGPDITIRGLSVGNWSFGGIIIEGTSATNILIEDNNIGLGSYGSFEVPNGGPAGIGIYGGASDIQIFDNVISANGSGIRIDDEPCPFYCVMPAAAPSGIVISGNKIGTTAAGTAARPNLDYGIIADDATDLTISDNVISASGVVNVALDSITTAVVEGNRIGTNEAGTAALGTAPVTAGIGVGAYGTSSGVTIGGAAAAQRNVIAGNYGRGIDLVSPGVVAQNNAIGTDASGLLDLPNRGAAIWASTGSSDSQILDNAINGWVLVAGFGSGSVSDVLIQNNHIGVTADGSAVFPSAGQTGITLSDGSTGAQVLDNVIAGQSLWGIEIELDSSAHTIQGNYIGTNAAGDAALGMAAAGVRVWGAGAVGNVIGGPGAGNVISGLYVGISLAEDSSGTVIQGNKIGTSADGISALPNAIGIEARGGASGNVIGGAGAAEGNLISGNTSTGIYLADAGTTSQILGNTIGLSASGSPLANGEGIFVLAEGQQIGGSAGGEGNVISGNTGTGIMLLASDNEVIGNSVGVTASGASAGNGGEGISVSSSGNTVTGNEVAYSADGYPGIYIWDAEDNVVNQNTVHDNGSTGIAVGTSSSGFASGNTLSQNLTYANRNLGIDLAGAPWFGVTANDPGDADTGPNNLLNFPVLSTVTTILASGTACPNCTVEVFLADDDPSGHGEGMEFIASGATDASGAFAIPLSGVGTCEPITATATDGGGNTSEYSPNIAAGTCVEVPTFAIVVELIGFLLLGGAAAGLFGRGRGVPAVPLMVGGAAAGCLVGGALIGMALALPNVHLPTAPPSAPEEAPALVLPACSKFLLLEEVRPADGAVFEPNDEPIFEWSPQPALPGGQVRWVIELVGRAGVLASAKTSDLRLPFSALGLGAAPRGHYLWRLAGETAARGSDLWTPFCQPTGLSRLTIGTLRLTPQMPLPTVTPLPPTAGTETPTPTLTSAPTLLPVLRATPTRTPTPSPTPSATRIRTATPTPTLVPTTETPPDTQGPSIKSISDSPDPIKVTQPKGCTPTTSTVTASISDPSGVQSAVVLFFHAKNGQVPMSHGGGNTWTAILGPYTSIGDGTVDYQIRATDGNGNISESGVGQITVLACIP